MNSSKFYMSDPWLEPFRCIIDSRIAKCTAKERQLVPEGSLPEFAMGHYYYGLHRDDSGWIFR